MIVILTRCISTNVIIQTVLAWAVELCSNSGKELFILTTCCIVTTVIIQTMLAWAVELCSNSGKELFILTICCIATVVNGFLLALHTSI